MLLPSIENSNLQNSAGPGFGSEAARLTYTLYSFAVDRFKQWDHAGHITLKRGDIHVDLGLSAMLTAGISFGDARQLAANHGLTGSKPLPPGIRKNLARGKPMPPGIAKTRMPDSFINQLPQHDGYEWQQAGSDLVLVVTGSLVISDVLEGVFD